MYFETSLGMWVGFQVFLMAMCVMFGIWIERNR